MNNLRKIKVLCPNCRNMIDTYPIAVENKSGEVNILMACPICKHGWKINVDRKELFNEKERKEKK